MPAYLYILKDCKNKFYIGSTIDLRRRLVQHKNGHTQTTRNMEEPKLVLNQKYRSLGEARFVERKLKKLKRKDYIEKMIHDGYIRIKPENQKPSSFNGQDTRLRIL